MSPPDASCVLALIDEGVAPCRNEKRNRQHTYARHRFSRCTSYEIKLTHLDTCIRLRYRYDTCLVYWVIDLRFSPVLQRQHLKQTRDFNYGANVIATCVFFGRREHTIAHVVRTLKLGQQSGVLPVINWDTIAKKIRTAKLLLPV